jgi:hypothetical protein
LDLERLLCRASSSTLLDVYCVVAVVACVCVCEWRHDVPRWALCGNGASSNTIRQVATRQTGMEGKIYHVSVTNVKDLTPGFQLA